MNLLKDKNILISGMLTSSSLAYGIAKACRREGAELAFTYHNESIAKRVRKLADQLGSKLCFPCDVADDEQIARVHQHLSAHWNGLDGFVHAIGFAPAEAIAGDLFSGLSRQSFRIAHEISSYSFPAMAKAVQPLMRKGGSMLTMSYIGAVRTMPSYNSMGMAKASLEASVKYMAKVLGPHNVRVNAISSAPIRTVASSGLGSIEKLLSDQETIAPLAHEISIEDVGNTAMFLLSDLAAGISSQIIYVDGGFSSS